MTDTPRILFQAAIVLAAMFGASLARADSLRAPGTPTICPMIYMPVCASDGTSTKVFANSCVAKSSGFDVVEATQCGAAPEPEVRSCEEGQPCGRRPLGLGKTRPS